MAISVCCHNQSHSLALARDPSTPNDFCSAANMGTAYHLAPIVSIHKKLFDLISTSRQIVKLISC